MRNVSLGMASRPDFAGWVTVEICFALLLEDHFGAAAEGWNSCSPSTLYAPIAACPSGDSSHWAKRLANACSARGALPG